MEKTLAAQIDPQGVGLAAPQVGRNIQLFIIKPSPKTKTEVFINPKILKLQTDKKKSSEGRSTSGRKSHKLEGCLSIPRIWSPVTRAKKMQLEYFDLNGKKYTKWFTGFEAVIIQHEVDHLEGILFTQRAIEQKSQLYEETDGKLKKMEY